MTQIPNRSLGATEKLFWLLDQASQVHFVMAAELSGKVTSFSLQEALAEILKRHPLLSSRIVANGYENPYFEHVPHSVIPLRIIQQHSDQTLAAEMAKELSMPFNWDIAPLIRCVLVNDAENPIILFAVHHAVSDGISMTIVIRDMLQVLDGEPLSISAIPPSIDQLLALDPGIPVLARHMLHETDKPLIRRKQSIPNIYFEKIDAELSAQIFSKSKMEGTSFQGTLYAAAIKVARASSFPWSQDQIRVVVPISVRKDLTDGESSCLYINSRTLLSQEPPEVDFWDLARNAKRELQDVHEQDTIQTNGTIARGRLFSGIPVADLSLALQQGKVREMMISNLGRFPYNTTLDKTALHAIWGPVALSGTPNEITIGLTTVNGSICVTIATRDKASHFLGNLVAELKKACSL